MDTKSSYGLRFSRKALLATAASCLLAAVFHAPATLAQKLPGVGAELPEAMEKRLAQVDSGERSHAVKLGRFVESEFKRKLEEQRASAVEPGGQVKVGTALAQPLAATVLTTVKAGDSAEGADDEESVVLNFEGADIREVIFALASSLGINYWIDPRVAGHFELDLGVTKTQLDQFNCS